MIELKNIEKTFDDGFQALTDINLSFEEGKINVLIGPSGCGKTTTMKLLNRLEDYTNGEILIDSENIKDIDPIALRRKMGFVIQNIGLFPHMTIYNNVATVPKLLHWDKKKIHNRVTELLEMVNLDPKIYMKRYPSELSGGQQQRIGVIRALAAEPSTILMDEPFSALDPISREQLQDELIRLQTEISKTIIFVTHDMDEALKIADQIILMKDGHIVQQGSPQEIMASPANDFVKDFIGEKRLGSEVTLPQLDQFIADDYPVISDTSTVDAALETLIARQVAEAPVVKGDGNYRGFIDLYDLFSGQDQQLTDLIKVPELVITEEEDTESALNKLHDIRDSTPIVASDNTLVGILDKNKLLQALKHATEDKRGVV